MTLPNKITILRILLVPFFVVQILYYTGNGKEIHRFLGILAFAIAAISDGIDGYIARRYNQRSELGAILDPLADKLLLVLGLVVLSLDNRPYLEPIPLWLVATVFSRDVILLIGLAVIYYTVGRVRVKPHMSGKVATVLQMVAVSWALLKWNSGWLFWIALSAAVFTGVSALIYLQEGIRQLSASPASNPSPNKNDST